MYRRLCGLATLLFISTLTSANASADVIITEIFYNLYGSENGETEWIEIANTGDTAVDLTGWSYGDSQDNVFASPFASGTTLEAKEAAVIVFQDPAVFNEIWGGGIKVFQIDTAISLGNNGSLTNETVAIRDSEGQTVDEVNYESGGQAGETFPAGMEGHTIYLKSGSFDVTSNDFGVNWAMSEIGIDGAYQALLQNPDVANVDPGEFDIASPGFVAGLNSVPEPTSTIVMGCMAFAVLAGRRKR